MRIQQRGFTLIELLMVITIIAVLLLIVLARIYHVSLRARESALRENLHHLRVAIEQFQSDVGGYPTSLEQLVVSRSEAPSVIPATDATGKTLFADGYKGPYISPDRMPTDPLTQSGIWGYDPTDGHVYSLSERLGMNNTPYSTW